MPSAAPRTTKKLSSTTQEQEMKRDGSNDSVSYNQILGVTKPRTRDAAKLRAIHKDLGNYRERRSNQDIEHTTGSNGDPSYE